MLRDTDPGKGTAGAAQWVKVTAPALVFLACRWMLQAACRTAWAEAAGTGLLLAAFSVLYFRQSRPEPIGVRKVLREALLYVISGLAAGGLLCLIASGENGNRSMAAVLLVCALAPACEEIVYRGLVFETAEKPFGFVPALIVSTALFACGHRTPAQMATAVPAGLVLGTIRKKEGNILAPVFFHAALNAAALIFAAQAG